MNLTDAGQRSDPPILSEETTLDRLKGDSELLTTLYRVFLGDLPKKLVAIDEAAADNDLNALQRSAHSLKGASATIGADALREAAFNLEMAAKGNDLDLAGSIVPRLKEIARATGDMIDKSL